MNKLVPFSIQLIEKAKDSVLLEFHLDPELFWFRGHFPVQPILPGVAQLEWVNKFAKEFDLTSLPIRDIRQVKFTVPMVPQDKVQLSLTIEEKLGKRFLAFNYKVWRNNEWVMTSQGKVLA